MKNQDLIGKVVNCPKCNSMVMVSPPQQIRVEAPNRFPVDSTELTRDDFAEAAPSHHAPASDVAAPEDDEYRLSPLSEDHPVNSAPLVTPATDADSQSWKPDEPLLPTDDWSSEKSARSKQFLLVTFLALSGVGLSIIGFLLFLNWYSAPPSNADDETLASANVALDDGPPAEDVGTTSLGGVSEDDADPLLDEETDSTLNDGPTDSDPTSATASTDDPIAPADANTDAADTNTTGAGTNDTEFNVNDPFDAAISDTASTDESTPVDDGIPNEQMRRMQEALDWRVVPTLPSNSEALLPPPKTAADLGLTSSSIPDPLPPIDWELRSQTPISGISFGGKQNLSRVLNTFAHATGMPVQPDLRSLRAAGIDVSSTVALTVQSTTPVQIADALANVVGAEIQTKNESYLVLRGPDAKIAERLPRTLDLSALANDEQFKLWFAELLPKLFPGSVGLELDDQNILAGDTVERSDWFDVIQLTHTLHKVHGKSLPLETADFQLEEQKFVTADQLDFLDRALGQMSPQEIPIGELLGRICGRQNDVWMDWPSLGQVGVGPSTAALVITNGRSLRKTLENLIRDLSIEVAIESEHGLWITSPQSYRRMTRIYVMDSNGRTVEQWQAELDRFTPLNKDGVGDMVVSLTPDRQHVVVRCCLPRIEVF